MDRKSGTNLLSTDSLVRLAEDGLAYICQDSSLDLSSDSDLNAAQEVAKLALQGSEIQPSIFDRQLVRTASGDLKQGELICHTIYREVCLEFGCGISCLLPR